MDNLQKAIKTVAKMEIKPNNRYRGLEFSENICRHMADNLGRNQPLMLVGGPGSGKTTLPMEVAHCIDREILMVDISGDLQPRGIMGSVTLREDDEGNTITEWRDGVFADAVRNGKILIANELTTARPDVLAAIHDLFDSDPAARRLVLDDHLMPDGGPEILIPHKDFFFVGTSNHAPSYSNSSMHGNRAQDPAFWSRFDVIEFPTDFSVEKVLAHTRNPSDEIKEWAEILAGPLQELWRTAEAGKQVKLEYTLRVAQGFLGYLALSKSPMDSYRRTIGNKMSKSESESLYKTVFEMAIGEEKMNTKLK